jgi:RNA polymerase sigma-70 factor, ECF subfamily
MSSSISATFERLEPTLRAALGNSPASQARLDQLASSLAAAASIGREQAALALLERLKQEDAQDLIAALDSFIIDDLSLALACAAHHHRALANFEERFGREIDRAIRKSPGLGLGTDEFRQIIREKLFVASGTEAPRIASYGGRAPLIGWLRVICARTVIDLARKHHEVEPAPRDEELFDRLASRDNPELQAIRSCYAEVLPRAFRAALAELHPRQRNLLRQRYLHGTPASALATSYGVHRATLFGWLEEAREQLLNRMQREVRAAVAESSLDSVMGLMGSELNWSIRRMLDANVEPDQ